MYNLHLCLKGNKTILDSFWMFYVIIKDDNCIIQIILSHKLWTLLKWLCGNKYNVLFLVLNAHSSISSFNIPYYLDPLILFSFTAHTVLNMETKCRFSSKKCKINYRINMVVLFIYYIPPCCANYGFSFLITRSRMTEIIYKHLIVF